MRSAWLGEVHSEDPSLMRSAWLGEVHSEDPSLMRSVWLGGAGGWQTGLSLTDLVH